MVCQGLRKLKSISFRLGNGIIKCGELKPLPTVTLTDDRHDLQGVHKYRGAALCEFPVTFPWLGNEFLSLCQLICVGPE